MGNKRIHELSDVQSKNIGENSVIWQFVVVLSGAVIGRNCNINCNVFIENDVIIGDNVTIKSGVQLWDGLRIKNDVFIGPNVSFTNDKTPRSKRYPQSYSTVVVGSGASIGANSTIVGTIEIGEYAMVGAGSVLTKSVPPFTLWFGNPAVHKGYVTEDGEILDLNLKSRSTDRQFEYVNQKLVMI
jgi:acetyltransferase-like isoleucine patch superfamily enzyme